MVRDPRRGAGWRSSWRGGGGVVAPTADWLMAARRPAGSETLLPPAPPVAPRGCPGLRGSPRPTRCGHRPPPSPRLSLGGGAAGPPVAVVTRWPFAPALCGSARGTALPVAAGGSAASHWVKCIRFDSVDQRPTAVTPGLRRRRPGGLLSRPLTPFVRFRGDIDMHSRHA